MFPRAADFDARATALAARRGWSARTARLALWLHEAALSPFLDFFRRYGWHAALVLALIATYRISDIVMGVNNILDEEPPLMGNTLSTNANTVVGFYDTLGMFLFANVTFRF